MVLCRSDVVWLLLLVKRLELSNHPEEALPADETTLSDTVKCQTIRYSENKVPAKLDRMRKRGVAKEARLDLELELRPTG